MTSVATEGLAETQAKPQGYERGSRRSWIAVFGGLIGSFMAILDIQITNASMREIQSGLGATLSEASWISTAYLVAEMIAIPLSGWLSKGLAVKRYLVLNASLFILSSLLCSIAWDLNSMIAFRAMQGFFGGALIPMAFRLVLELLPDNKRAVGMTLFGVTATFAPSIGPTLGGWLTETFSWHYVFYLNVPPGILVIAMLTYGLKANPIDWSHLKKFDFSSILTMALGLGCLEVVLEEGNKKGWFDSDLIRNLAIISVVNIIAFVVLQFNKKNPLVDLRLFKHKDFALSTVAYFVLGFVLFAAIYVIPLYLTQIQDYTPMQIGEVLMWMGFPQLLILPFMPKIAAKVDVRYMAAFGFALFGLSYYMNCHMSADFAGPQFILSLVIRAMGQPFIMVSLGMLSTMHLKPEQNASASTLVNMMRNLGGAFGIAIVSTLTDNFARTHLANLKETVPAVSVTAQQYLSHVGSVLTHAGSNPIAAQLQASAMFAKTMLRQAYVQAYNDVFYIMTFTLVVAVASVLLVKPKQKPL